MLRCLHPCADFIVGTYKKIRVSIFSYLANASGRTAKHEIPGTRNPDSKCIFLNFCHKNVRNMDKEQRDVLHNYLSVGVPWMTAGVRLHHVFQIPVPLRYSKELSKRDLEGRSKRAVLTVRRSQWDTQELEYWQILACPHFPCSHCPAGFLTTQHFVESTKTEQRG